MRSCVVFSCRLKLEVIDGESECVREREREREGGLMHQFRITERYIRWFKAVFTK